MVLNASIFTYIVTLTLELVSNRVNKALCYMIVIVDVVDVDVVASVVYDDDVVVVNVGIVFFLVQYILFDITMNLSDTFRSTISQFTLQHRLDKQTTIQCQQCVWYMS